MRASRLLVAGSCLTVASCTFTWGPFAPTQPPLEIEPLPAEKQPLPIYEHFRDMTRKLASRDVFGDLVHKRYPGAVLETDERSPPATGGTPLTKYTDGERVVAWLDAETGETRLHPDLKRLTALSKEQLSAASKAAEAALRDLDLGANPDPRSVSVEPVIRLAPPRTLSHAQSDLVTAASDKTTVPPEAVLVFRRAIRTIGPYQVEGPGSRALVGVGASGDVESLVRIWKPARRMGRATEPVPKQEIVTAIRDGVARFRALGKVLVRTRIVYYDGNDKLIQPAYRVEVRVDPKGEARPLRFVGYLAYARNVEEKLPAPWEALAALPPTRQAFEPKSADGETLATPVRVRRYVAKPLGTVHHDVMLGNATAFWSALSKTSPFTDGGAVDGASSQEVVKGMDAGTGQLVLVEAHGAPGQIHMNDLAGDPLDFSDLTVSKDGSQLAADVVLHSCSVIPSPVDDADWAKYWWPLLGGARSVMGYRTDAYVNDGAPARYAGKLALKAALLPVWLTEVASSTVYPDLDPANGKREGRPAAVSICEHEHDTADKPIRRQVAKCISIWWLDD